MYALMPWIAVIVTALAGWALIKRYSTHMVLLFAGLAILLCAVVLGDPNFLPKGVKPSGFVLFDIFNTLKSIATKQSAGIGFLIMTAGGFAAYMDRIGAAKALVDIRETPQHAASALPRARRRLLRRSDSGHGDPVRRRPRNAAPRRSISDP
ncbi:hypothetical protein [Sutterella wadsworthensis]|uniref:hypothetical protein n=1 Tax=Sutterella wadsworthensis TaxID=40545 RepID=UPI0039671EC2